VLIFPFVSFFFFFGIVESNLNHLKHVIEVLNVDYYRVYDDDISCILSSLRNTLLYERLADHGPKKGKISLEAPLFDPYFSQVPQKDKSRNPLEHILANNGWIWGGDPLVDFAGPMSNAYFRREVIIWGDSVKLRYGKSRVSKSLPFFTLVGLVKKIKFKRMIALGSGITWPSTPG